MADSENSRTLSAITCGNLLWATQCLLDEQFRLIESPDRSLLSWNTWLDASRETARLNQQQQDLEDQIFRLRRIGVETSECSEGLVGALLAPDCLDQKASSGGKVNPNVAVPDNAGVSGSLRHNPLYARHDDARQAELKASDREDDLADALFCEPAGSLLGSVAKLHCLLKREQPSQESEEHPWPEIRSVLADLLILIDPETLLAVQGCSRAGDDIAREPGDLSLKCPRCTDQASI
ncbi:hypothetical protein [Rhizobium sp.]|uniref:hypothetical protein n=1 Tax=Rhizobium sp. TaxID=391 RepID=UPI0028ABE890